MSHHATTVVHYFPSYFIPYIYPRHIRDIKNLFQAFVPWINPVHFLFPLDIPLLKDSWEFLSQPLSFRPQRLQPHTPDCCDLTLSCISATHSPSQVILNLTDLMPSVSHQFCPVQNLQIIYTCILLTRTRTQILHSFWFLCPWTCSKDTTLYRK